MKNNFFFSFLLLFPLLSGLSLSGQSVSKLKALKGFEGNVGEWGIKKQDMVMPNKGYSFFEIDEALILIIPQEKATAQMVVNTLKSSANFQTAVFGESYEAFKKKKKKKPKPSIRVVCKSKPNCNYSCYAILDSQNQFIRCGGECCEAGEGVWGSSGVGTVLETISM